MGQKGSSAVKGKGDPKKKFFLERVCTGHGHAAAFPRQALGKNSFYPAARVVRVRSGY